MTIGETFAGVRSRTVLTPEIGSIELCGIEYDSRRAGPGSLFFAFPGKYADGRSFAIDAITHGAVAVASESPRPAGFAGLWIEVEHGRQAMAVAARNFHGKLDRKIAVHGVTGTNGKTTTAFLIDAMLRAAGKTTALIGTIEYHVAGRIIEAVNTTPDSAVLHRLLAELDAAGGSQATLEVSSHALALGRVYGLEFQTAIFTNLTRDHLDFHGTMEDYFAAKRLLFEGAGAAPPRAVVLNADDPYARKITVSAESTAFWYGLGSSATVRASHISSSIRGLSFDVEHREGRFHVESPLVGKINVYNILAACSTGLAQGMDGESVSAGIAACRAVPGRFERVHEGQPFGVIVDYAHTDDALRNTIAVARVLTAGRVITLFGCGGDRDRSKRPLMGQAAAEASDFVVLTSDNPRSEDPLSIINDALVGLRRRDTPHVIEPDRAVAIRRAIEEAKDGDIVILAGKGHERYQTIAGRSIDFDDRKVARDVLKGFGYGR